MVRSSLTVQRYHGKPSNLGIAFLSEPALGNHAMLSINVQGVDLAVHMNVEDLERLHAAAGEVLAKLQAIADGEKEAA